ncbi:MAG: C1 family peptidase [Bacteroidia bacterium]
MKKSIQLIGFCVLMALNTFGQNFVQVTKINALESVSINQQQVLEIKLPAQPSTGFGWYLKNKEQGIVMQAGDWNFVPDDLNNPVGTPGIQTIRYIGTARGANELEFLYKRPWEEDSQATDNYTIKVTSEGIYNGKSLVTENQDQSILPDNGSYSVYGLPTSFSWQKEGLCTPCKNQGSCGSCWTFAACGSFESVIKIFDGVTRDLSEQWLVNCDKRFTGCSGGWCPNSMFKTLGAVYEVDQKYAGANGTCKSSYTYHEKINGSYELSTNPTVAQIKQAIYDYGPVWAAIDAGSNFQNYKSGGVMSKSDGTQVNHAIVLVGWDDATGSWVLRNSWGSSWGENNGYMRIKYGVSNVGYKATYIDYKGKISHTATYINDITSNSMIKLFPNPSNGTFNIEGLEKQNNIKIYDVVGNVIYNTISDNSTTTINLSSTAKGMYFYKITNLTTNSVKQGKFTLN